MEKDPIVIPVTNAIPSISSLKITLINGTELVLNGDMAKATYADYRHGKGVADDGVEYPYHAILKVQPIYRESENEVPTDTFCSDDSQN